MSIDRLLDLSYWGKPEPKEERAQAQHGAAHMMWINRVLSKALGFLRCTSGIASIEFALVLPLYIAVFAGVFEIGRGLFAFHAGEEAARGAARYLARVQATQCCTAGTAAYERALDMVEEKMQRSTGTISAFTPQTTGEGGTLTVSFTVTLQVPLMRIVNGSPTLQMQISHAQPHIAS